MFSEFGLQPHSYLLIAAIVSLILFFGYVFWFDHKDSINESDFWKIRFRNAGLTDEQIFDITHDDSMWYYQRVSTCVGYGPSKEACPKHESYCAGDYTFGEEQDQAKEVAAAIKKGGIHESCPLIYSGTD